MAPAHPWARPTNLPAELTSLVGRRKELSEVKRLLKQTPRLLTLTGSGGAGYTDGVKSGPGALRVRHAPRR